MEVQSTASFTIPISVGYLQVSTIGEELSRSITLNTKVFVNGMILSFDQRWRPVYTSPRRDVDIVINLIETSVVSMYGPEPKS